MPNIRWLGQGAKLSTLCFAQDFARIDYLSSIAFLAYETASVRDAQQKSVLMYLSITGYCIHKKITFLRYIKKTVTIQPLSPSLASLPLSCPAVSIRPRKVR